MKPACTSTTLKFMIIAVAMAKRVLLTERNSRFYRRKSELTLILNSKESESDSIKCYKNSITRSKCTECEPFNNT